MRVAVLMMAFSVFAAPAGVAQRGSGGGGAAQYNGYAFVECTASNTPAVRLVLLQGVVPAALPATAPRPSLALVLTGTATSIVGAEIALSKDPAGPGRIVSCPVVGECVLAETGAATIGTRGDDGALSGEFRATWPPFPQRMGTFTVSWRDSGKSCG